MRTQRREEKASKWEEFGMVVRFEVPTESSCVLSVSSTAWGAWGGEVEAVAQPPEAGGAGGAWGAPRSQPLRP